MSVQLYISNLAFDTSREQLHALFAEVGKVESVRVIQDHESGRSRGFGFIEMSTQEEGAAAIKKFNGHDLSGRALKVNAAKPRDDR